MMKTYKNILILSVCMMGALSCTDDFEDMNTNPNLPTEVSPSSMLRSVIFDPINPNINMQMKFIGQVMQYWVFTNESSFDRYAFSGDAGVTDAYWEAAYLSLRNSKTLTDVAGDDDGYKAASLILDAYTLSVLTDIWTDVPAAEAGLGLENILPAYESQQAVFTDILSKLTDANNLLASGNSKFGEGGDVLFGGNVERWRKMANSLRLKYLMRVSNPGKYANAQSDFEEIVNDPATYPVITGNADQAVYDFSGAAPNVADFSNSTTISGITMSERFIDLMANGTNASAEDEADDDPRLSFFAAKVNPDETKKVGYAGVASGGPESNAKTVADFDNATKFRPIFQNDKGLFDFAYISYAELQFIMAEAALKGWDVPESAQAYYENGIKANLAYWGITNMPDDFLTRNALTGDDDNQLEQIMNQKWIAGIGLNIFGIWADQKRTGHPILKIGAEAVGISTTVPSRMHYPVLEQAVNKNNVDAAIAALGGTDGISIKQWYQD